MQIILCLYAARATEKYSRTGKVEQNSRKQDKLRTDYEKILNEIHVKNFIHISNTYCGKQSQIQIKCTN